MRGGGRRGGRAGRASLRQIGGQPLRGLPRRALFGSGCHTEFLPGILRTVQFWERRNRVCGHAGESATAGNTDRAARQEKRQACITRVRTPTAAKKQSPLESGRHFDNRSTSEPGLVRGTEP